MNTKCMVELQGNEIETTITFKGSVVDEWISNVLPTAHCFQNIVGFCRQIFYSGKYHQHVPEGTRLLQVCIGTKCLLYQPLDFNADKPRLLDSLFGDPALIFVGVDVKEKMNTLLQPFRPPTSIDIEELAVERWCWPKKGVNWKPGLKVLAKSVADNLDIGNKMPERVRLSLGGSKADISVEKIQYAAVEVYALFRIGCKMLKHGYAVPSIMKSACGCHDDDE